MDRFFFISLLLMNGLTILNIARGDSFFPLQSTRDDLFLSQIQGLHDILLLDTRQFTRPASSRPVSHIMKKGHQASISFAN